MKDFDIGDLAAFFLLVLIVVGSVCFYAFVLQPIDETYSLEATPIEVKDAPGDLSEEIPADVIQEVEQKEEHKKPVLSDEEIIAMVVHAEAQGEPMIGKVAVACVVYNRCDRYGLTVESVVNAKNQFAISDSYTEEDLRAVEIARDNRDLYPENMLYFRTEDYHTFGSNWLPIGNHYFSLESEDN